MPNADSQPGRQSPAVAPGARARLNHILFGSGLYNGIAMLLPYDHPHDEGPVAAQFHRR